MPRVRGSCRAPLGKRLWLYWNHSGPVVVRIVFTSLKGGLAVGGCGLLGGLGGAHCLHLLRMRWVSGWRVRVTRGRRSRASCLTSLRWGGRWVVSASYSGVMVVRMVFTSWRSAVGRRGRLRLRITQGWRCRAWSSPRGGGRRTAGPSGLLGGGGVAHFVLLAAVSGRFLRAGNLR